MGNFLDFTADLVAGVEFRNLIYSCRVLSEDLFQNTGGFEELLPIERGDPAQIKDGINHLVFRLQTGSA